VLEFVRAHVAFYPSHGPLNNQRHPSEIIHIEMNLYGNTLLRLGAAIIIFGLVLFVTAGTIRYWQAWVYLAVYAGASLLISLYLVKHDPALLKRRLSGGPTAEKRTAQKVIMFFASVGFLGLLVVPALDYRFGWSIVPFPVVILGNILVVVGFYLVLLVYEENTYTSAIIEVAEEQKVISTGPYEIVRHPMYASALLYLYRHTSGPGLVLGLLCACLPVATSDLAAF
jgi:protein-S-isoprenylcysteine O-methyltransferase Ste14